MAALSPSYILLVLFSAAYLASRTAALSRYCSSDYPALPASRHDPFLTANTTVAIYCVLDVNCSFGRALPHGPNVGSSPEHRGSITPPYDGGVHFDGINVAGVLEDVLMVVPPPTFGLMLCRHLPVDLGSSKEKQVLTQSVLWGDHLLLSSVNLPLQMGFYLQTAQAQYSKRKLEYAVVFNCSANLSVPIIVVDQGKQPSPKTGERVNFSFHSGLLFYACGETLGFSSQHVPSYESTIFDCLGTRILPMIRNENFSYRDVPIYESTGTVSPRNRRLLSGASGRSAAKQHVAIHAKVASWSWKEKASVVGALAAASALLGLIFIVAGLLLCCMRRRSVPKLDLWRKLGPREFSHSELAAATCNFAEERKIGRGGFDPVYRGYLSDQDRHVAIKVLSREQSVLGLKEFRAEVTVMSQLRHRHIVQLVGWCDSRRGLLLVYELMPGGSLDTHLYNPEKLLTWSERYKIALGLGSALLYLHTDCDKCVVHGDIKPANVMLDALCNAKLGDFGLARLADHGAEPQTTQVVAGTVGYIDPGFVNNGRPRTESDVYSFGVVLLEIASGRRPASTQSNGASVIQRWVRDMYDRGRILDAADRRLNGEFDERQMERVLVTGLWCAHEGQSQRPSIAQAMDVLRSEEAKLPVLPAMSSAEQIRALEEHAFGDLTSEHTASANASTATVYLTSKSSTYLLAEE